MQSVEVGQQGALEDVPELGALAQQQQQEGGEAFLVISLPEQVRLWGGMQGLNLGLAVWGSRGQWRLCQSWAIQQQFSCSSKRGGTTRFWYIAA